MNSRPLSPLISLLLCGSLAADNTPPIPTASGPEKSLQKLSAPRPESVKAAEPPTLAVAADIAARLVHYGDRDVIPVNARLRFSTLIVLPKSEMILDFVCGDKEFWIVNGAQNFAYVKPAKAGSHTNLNLVTASGNVYSFVLREGEGSPDLKLFVEPRDESMISAANGTPRFVSAQQIDDYRQQVEIAKAEVRETKQAAQTVIDREVTRFRSDYPRGLRHSYRFDRTAREGDVFRVAAIFNDDKFTYIQANPQETPALYEVKDGKPNLIQFEFQNGTFTIPKILDSGYLTIGKKRFHFSREEN